jgi:hypothetical protein
VARSCCGRSSVKSESLDHGGVMMMTPADNLDDDARFQRCVWFTFGSQGGCVFPHDGRVPSRSWRVFVSVFGRFSTN